jgi:hypothetical protein
MASRPRYGDDEAGDDARAMDQRREAWRRRRVSHRQRRLLMQLRRELANLDAKGGRAKWRST